MNYAAVERGYSGSVRVVALALVALAVAAGCGSSDDQSAAPSAQTTATPELPVAAREVAPMISGMTLDGDAIALGDFRGRPVLVNVWSSW